MGAGPTFVIALNLAAVWCPRDRLALLGGLFLLSLVRQGPRAFVGELFEADGDGEEGHDHDHDQGEDELDDCCQDDCCAAPESSPSLIAEHTTTATYEAPR